MAKKRIQIGWLVKWQRYGSLCETVGLVINKSSMRLLGAEILGSNGKLYRVAYRRLTVLSKPYQGMKNA